MPPTKSSRLQLVYVINSFDTGGAERGLLCMARNGFFDGMDATIAAIVRGGGDTLTELERLGVSPVLLTNDRKMRIASLPVALRRLYTLISDLAPDVIVGSLPQANLLARVVAIGRRQLACVSFEHNTHLARGFYEYGFRLTSGRVNMAFCDAERTLSIAGERLYRKPPAAMGLVPLVAFDSPPNPPRQWNGGPFRILNAGRLTSTKNQAALIEALALLRSEGRDVNLGLLGDGPDREALAGLAAKLGLTAYVRFHGFVRDWTATPGDLFVLSSRHEGLCIVLLEAMHAGIPAVAPSFGGIQDYGDPSVMGVLPDVRPVTLAAAINEAMNDYESCRARAAHAAAMVVDRWGAGAVCAQYARVRAALENIVAQRVGATGAGVTPSGKVIVG